MRKLAHLLLFTLIGLSARAPKLVGTVIPHPVPAPDFTLTDQHGLPFRMSDTKGKVVVIAFIYTRCTDLCPFSMRSKRSGSATGWASKSSPRRGFLLTMWGLPIAEG